MKKVALVLMALVLGGCAIGPYQPGFLYSGHSAPVTATGSDKECVKMGESEAINVLGMVSMGDGSIDAAKKNGQITEVSSVDYEQFSILSLFVKTTTKVCGE